MKNKLIKELKEMNFNKAMIWVAVLGFVLFLIGTLGLAGLDIPVSESFVYWQQYMITISVSLWGGVAVGLFVKNLFFTKKEKDTEEKKTK